MNDEFNVIGIGNALVDVLAHVDNQFLLDNAVQKGIMQLIGDKRAIELYSRMGCADRACGGSTANTIASLAQLGLNTGYIGKVKDDELGHVLIDDFARFGVVYTTPLAPDSVLYETGRCLVLITPDGERSLNTYLGAAEFLDWEDFDQEMIVASQWIYLEGYRFDGQKGQEAFHQATKICRQSGGKTALTLSDPICVNRHRAAFHKLIDDGIDLLLCNRAELLSLYNTESIDVALSKASDEIELIACTLAEQGAVVISGANRIVVAAESVDVVDVTGAGDLFAAGFLFGLIQALDIEITAKLGCVAAAEVISHLGARPIKDLAELFRAKQLI